MSTISYYVYSNNEYVSRYIFTVFFDSCCHGLLLLKFNLTKLLNSASFRLITFSFLLSIFLWLSGSFHIASRHLLPSHFTNVAFPSGIFFCIERIIVD